MFFKICFPDAMELSLCIVDTQLEHHHPLLKGGGEGRGVGPSRNWVTWGGSKIFAGKEWQPWKGGGKVDVDMGGFHFFYYYAIQLHLLHVCAKSKVPFIMFLFFSLLS